jgi:hypothetical protein
MTFVELNAILIQAFIRPTTPSGLTNTLYCQRFATSPNDFAILINSAR